MPMNLWNSMEPYSLCVNEINIHCPNFHQKVSFSFTRKKKYRTTRSYPAFPSLRQTAVGFVVNIKHRIYRPITSEYQIHDPRRSRANGRFLALCEMPPHVASWITRLSARDASPIIISAVTRSAESICPVISPSVTSPGALGTTGLHGASNTRGQRALDLPQEPQEASS